MDERADSSGVDEHPHQGQPIETAGTPQQAAEAAVVTLYGRGSTAKQILRLVDEINHHGVAYLAPQAANNTWYPHSGFAPFEDNEPWFSSALDHVSSALEMAADAGVAPERTILLGFSQGGRLASEFVARNARRYGGLVVLSGSLLGPEPTDDYVGSIDCTPVFLGCGTDDSWVAAERAHETAHVLDEIGGNVTKQLYEGMGHSIDDDEVQVINTFIEQLI